MARNGAESAAPGSLAVGALAVGALAVGWLWIASPAERAWADGSPAPSPWFEDVAKSAGVYHPHRNRRFENPYAHIMEGYTALGAAVAVADVDGDGLEDLFVTDSSLGGKNRLYLNRGDFTFEDVAEAAGVAEGNDAANASADGLFFDMDNDGDPDLLVVRFGQNRLYENLGSDEARGVRFRDITTGSGLEGYLNCIAAIAFDYDLDGDLDLAYSNYFAPVNLFDPETPRFFPESFETATNGGGISLYRNDGRGKSGTVRFTDVTEQAGLGEISGWSLDLGHADADHDGDDDLYIAADFGTDSFFENRGDGTFADISEKAIGIDTKKGMNVDWGDFDRDGLFDLYVTNITDEYMKEGNFLWQNQGELSFADVSRETGTHDTGWGWAGKFFDADNDGWLDLYVVNGWVSGSEENYVLDVFELIIRDDIDLSDARNWPPMGEKTLSGYQRNSLFHNQGGALFLDVAADHGLDSLLDARGVAVVDFDRDGRLDLFVTNADKEPILARNVRPADRHWFGLWLEGARVAGAESGSNRDAVGARVEIVVDGTSRWSFVDGGNGFASQSTRQVHFGLGQAETVEKLRVYWPSGKVQTFEGLAADTMYRLREGGVPSSARKVARAPAPSIESPPVESPPGESTAVESPPGESPPGESTAVESPPAETPAVESTAGETTAGETTAAQSPTQPAPTQPELGSGAAPASDPDSPPRKETP